MLLSAYSLMMFYISMKFRENILNGFQVIETIQKDHCQMAKGNNSKNILKRAIVLLSAHGLMMLYISIKLHENILNCFQVIELTRFCDRQMDGRTNKARRRAKPRHN